MNDISRSCSSMLRGSTDPHTPTRPSVAYHMGQVQQLFISPNSSMSSRVGYTIPRYFARHPANFASTSDWTSRIANTLANRIIQWLMVIVGYNHDCENSLKHPSMRDLWSVRASKASKRPQILHLVMYIHKIQARSNLKCQARICLVAYLENQPLLPYRYCHGLPQICPVAPVQWQHVIFAVHSLSHHEGIVGYLGRRSTGFVFASVIYYYIFLPAHLKKILCPL